MISTGRQSGWYSDLQASWGPWWRFKFLNLFSMFHMRDKLHTINQMPSTVLNTELNKRQSWFLNIRTHWMTDCVSEWFSMLPCFPALTTHVSSLRLCAKERGFFYFPYLTVAPSRELWCKEIPRNCFILNYVPTIVIRWSIMNISVFYKIL